MPRLIATPELHVLSFSMNTSPCKAKKKKHRTLYFTAPAQEELVVDKGNTFIRSLIPQDQNTITRVSM